MYAVLLLLPDLVTFGLLLWMIYDSDRLRSDLRNLRVLYGLHEKTLSFQYTGDAGFLNRIKRLEANATVVDGQVARLEAGQAETSGLLAAVEEAHDARLDRLDERDAGGFIEVCERIDVEAKFRRADVAAIRAETHAVRDQVDAQAGTLARHPAALRSILTAAVDRATAAASPHAHERAAPVDALKRLDGAEGLPAADVEAIAARVGAFSGFGKPLAKPK